MMLQEGGRHVASKIKDNIKHESSGKKLLKYAALW